MRFFHFVYMVKANVARFFGTNQIGFTRQQVNGKGNCSNSWRLKIQLQRQNVVILHTFYGSRFSKSQY